MELHAGSVTTAIIIVKAYLQDCSRQPGPLLPRSLLLEESDPLQSEPCSLHAAANTTTNNKQTNKQQTDRQQNGHTTSI